MNNWEQFAQAWGPAIPMFLVICYLLQRLVFRAIPRGFRLLRSSIEQTGKQAQANHTEAMEALARLEDLTKKRCPPASKPTRKPRKP